MTRNIDYEHIGITNDRMFGTVFQNEEECRELLQRILGIRIREIHVVAQMPMEGSFFGKGSRLDIYAKDEDGNVYDIEMQTTMQAVLPLRSSYYHSEMDSYQIKKGQTYDNLKKSIVIFICTFDFFGDDRSVYTFESVCLEMIISRRESPQMPTRKVCRRMRRIHPCLLYDMSAPDCPDRYSSHDCITKYPAIFITGCFYCVGKYVLVLPFAKPSAFRIRSVALYCFCISWDGICELPRFLCRSAAYF